MNKKAQGLTTKKLVVLIIVLIVVIFFFIAVLNPSWLDWFRNLPDYNKTNGNFDDLIEPALINGVNVNILLNDGNGRCIVYNITDKDNQDSDVKYYGVRGKILEKFDEETQKWIEVEDKMNVIIDLNKAGNGSAGARQIYQEMLNHPKTGKVGFWGLNILGILSFVSFILEKWTSILY